MCTPLNRRLVEIGLKAEGRGEIIMKVLVGLAGVLFTASRL
jgi:hypothetical protein